MTYVPIVELDRDPEIIARQLDEICTEIGFFQIVGHGIASVDADAAWDAAAAFFDLPLADRLKVAIPQPGYPYGYSPYAAESLSRSLDMPAPPDLKEVFNAGPVDPPTHLVHDPDEAWVYSPNLWPESVPELRVSWTAYYRLMLRLCDRLMSLFARALRLAPDFFTTQIDQSPSALRAINYPAQDASPVPGRLRAGAHTDYGTLTVLRQDTVGGLQVLSRDNRWTAVDPVPDAFVVNIGDLMARWTNDRWSSTLHRVANPPDIGSSQVAGSRRQSMPFFHNANWNTQVSCLPTCQTPGQPAKYPAVVAGPHLMQKYRKTVAR